MASCATISDASTWSRGPPSTTRSARGCHPCLRYDPLPMCPVRTHRKNGAPGRITLRTPMSLKCRYDSGADDETRSDNAYTANDAVGARPSSASGGSSTGPSPTAWRKLATGSLTFTRLPPTQWRSVRTTSAIERLHEEFKRRIKTQTVLPSADSAAMLFWALLASGQINMRKVDGWRTLATKPIDKPIDLAA